MFRLSLFMTLILTLAFSLNFYCRDDMLYYEKYYPAHLERQNEKVREEVLSYLENKVSRFEVCDELSEKITTFSKTEDYEAIDLTGLITDLKLKYTEIWALKGKVFSKQNISNEMAKYSELFETLNEKKNVMLGIGMTGELEQGFNFVLVFYTFE